MAFYKCGGGSEEEKTALYVPDGKIFLAYGGSGQYVDETFYAESKELNVQAVNEGYVLVINPKTTPYTKVIVRMRSGFGSLYMNGYKGSVSTMLTSVNFWDANYNTTNFPSTISDYDALVLSIRNTTNAPGRIDIQLA